MHIGIVGARKYRDRQSVIELVKGLPDNATIITSGCKGVCTWAREAARTKDMKVDVYAPDLTDIRAWFEVPKRYYRRNRELVEACDFLYAFISRENGFAGGTRFEVEYACKLKIPVQIHWEHGLTETFYQYKLPFRGFLPNLPKRYIPDITSYFQPPWRGSGIHWPLKDRSPSSGL